MTIMMLLAAAARTLSTPELLELILSQLSAYDLLLAQRVCKTWHTLISSSPTLQTALFFHVPKCATSSKQHTLNPFINSAIPFLLTRDGNLSGDEIDKLDPEVLQITDAPKRFRFSAWSRYEEAWKRKEASWRDMYVALPPVTRVVFMRDSCGPAGEHVSEAVVEFGPREIDRGRERGWLKHGDHMVELENECGLKMGILYDYYWYQSASSTKLYWSMSFCWGYIDEWEAIRTEVEAQRGWVMGFKREGANLMAKRGDRKKLSGLTLVIETGWGYDGCCGEDGGGEIWERFRSDGYADVQFGPLREASSGMWD
jgi:hypothetical protein